MSNLYTVSGGAFYIKGLAKAVYLASEKVPIHIITGTSSGAIVAAVTAILGAKRMWDIAKDIDLSLSLKSPFTKSGSIKFGSVISTVFGKPLVSQDTRPLLKNIISEYAFKKYKEDTGSPECYILTANVDKGIRVLWNIKKIVTLQKLFDVIEGSSEMQGLCEGVILDGDLHWDGGQFDHQCGHLVLDREIFSSLTKEVAPSITSVVSVYSRPKNWNPDEGDFANKHPLAKSFRMVEMDNIEKSLNDEYKIDSLCLSLNIPQNKVFLPRVLSNFYDNDEKRQSILLTLTDQAVEDAFKLC